jgi:hypothetical protein
MGGGDRFLIPGSTSSGPHAISLLRREDAKSFVRVMRMMGVVGKVSIKNPVHMNGEKIKVPKNEKDQIHVNLGGRALRASLKNRIMYRHIK